MEKEKTLKEILSEKMQEVDPETEEELSFQFLSKEVQKMSTKLFNIEKQVRIIFHAIEKKKVK